MTMTRSKSVNHIHIDFESLVLNYHDAIDPIIEAVNEQRGFVHLSRFHAAQCYQRFDLGFYNPPLSIEVKDGQFKIRAWNQKGELLLVWLYQILAENPHLKSVVQYHVELILDVIGDDELIYEEDRSKKSAVFSLLKIILKCFSTDKDSLIGFYGAMGYDLVFQFEDIEKTLTRDSQQREMVLYLPDEIVFVDHQKQTATQFSYCFCFDNQSTDTIKKASELIQPSNQASSQLTEKVFRPNIDFSELVETALPYFDRGDLFEVTPSYGLEAMFDGQPATVFKRLSELNPAPYGMFVNLGDNEFLLSASPEMFVRVKNQIIESCPIAGTIARGIDACDDAKQIETLLTSDKDRSELSMCTDVDRNDKARICQPGSIKILERRRIEKYAKVIHTVDHVQGELKPEYEPLDGFLSHCWSATVTGAPKRAALQFIEDHEAGPRKWYGGAIGGFRFNGEIDTGITIRSIHIQKGYAAIRVGATLLHASDADAEKRETLDKAAVLLQAFSSKPLSRPSRFSCRQKRSSSQAASNEFGSKTKLHALTVDHHDSFVHSLNDYFRQFNVDVLTLRPEQARDYIANHGDKIDFVILSPGPGLPEDFKLASTLEISLYHRLPVFGVCLGLQGIVTYFGGSLARLAKPCHGESTDIKVLGGPIFKSVPKTFPVGRYHSYVVSQLPSSLIVDAKTNNDEVMAVRHRTLPISAVQFHPESILTMTDDLGLRLIENVVATIG